VIDLKIMAAVALAAAIIASLATYQIQEWRYGKEIAEIDARLQKASQVAVSQALAEQQRQMQVVEAESQQGEQDVEQIRIDIAADDTADRLRDQLTQVRRIATHTAANAATQRLADQQTVTVLTNMLEECSGFAGVVAGAYEEARARGMTCQRVYEGVRETSGQ